MTNIRAILLKLVKFKPAHSNFKMSVMPQVKGNGTEELFKN